MVSKLITVKEFADGLTSPDSQGATEDYSKLINYIDLLEQPLKLEMFIPCLDGVPLVKPDGLGMYDKKERITEDEAEAWYNDWCNDCEQYQQAESKVIFKGFIWDIEDQSLLWGALDFYYEEDDKIKDLLLEYPFEFEVTESFNNLITK